MTKKTKKIAVWDSKLDKKLSRIKEISKKNKNFFVFALTMEKMEGKTKTEGAVVSGQVNLIDVVRVFLRYLPEGVVQKALVSNILDNSF